jgi:WD40 repeat protein
MVNAVVDSKRQYERSEIVAHFESQTVLNPHPPVGSIHESLLSKNKMKDLNIKLVLIVTLAAITGEIFAQEGNTLWTAAWSPDGQYIAVGGDQDGLMLFDGQTFELIRSYPLEGVTISRLKWHPTENKLAVVTQSDSFTAKILDLDKNEWIDLEGLASSLRALDWNHSGEYLAVSEFEGEVSIYDINGNRVSRFMADPKSVTGIDWHPSKNILTAVGSQIGIYSLKGDTLNTFKPRKEETLLLCVEWHKSGDFFATGDYGDSRKAENKLIQYWTEDGQLIAQLEGSVGEYRNLRWSPDGEKLASASDALRVWSKKGKLIAQSETSEDYLWGIDWNSDGTLMITSSTHGKIFVWDENADKIRQIQY